MNSTRKTLTGESGSTLVVVMICAMVMLITALALVELGAQDAALAIRDVSVSQALYNAEAGAERGEAWLQGQASLPTTSSLGMRRKSNRWQREMMVSGTLWTSVVARTMTVWGGGSSRVFNRAFEAA